MIIFTYFLAKVNNSFYLCTRKPTGTAKTVTRTNKVLSAQALGNGLQAVTTRPPNPLMQGRPQAAEVATPQTMQSKGTNF